MPGAGAVYTPKPTAPAAPGTPNDWLSSILPGIGGLTTTATGNIQNLLDGLPSVSATRQANAYFGAGSGMPTSDFVRNRGYDLYGQQAAANREIGLTDLLKTIGSYSTPILENQGQQFQKQQAGAQLAQQGQQFTQSQAQQESQFARNLALGQSAQNIQNQQFGQDFGQRQYEFGQNYQLNSFDALLQALGLGNTITNTGLTPIPS